MPGHRQPPGWAQGVAGSQGPRRQAGRLAGARLRSRDLVRDGRRSLAHNHLLATRSSFLRSRGRSLDGSELRRRHLNS